MKKAFLPLTIDKLNTKSLKHRKSKVKKADLAKTSYKGISFSQFLTSLPNILAGRNFLTIIEKIIQAIHEEKGVVLAMGAHVIKCGLSPIILDLMQREVITGLALNGAGIIHDFELAIQGQTSEDVEEAIVNGDFGMAEETGQKLNEAINSGVVEGLGLGEAVGKYLFEMDSEAASCSLTAAAFKLKIPLTVHVAIGTDIIHMHPEARGDLIGRGSLQDFRLFCSLITSLHQGGVFLIIGSAVI